MKVCYRLVKIVVLDADSESRVGMSLAKKLKVCYCCRKVFVFHVFLFCVEADLAVSLL